MTNEKELLILKYQTRIHSLEQKDPSRNANLINKAKRKLRKLMESND